MANGKNLKKNTTNADFKKEVKAAERERATQEMKVVPLQEEYNMIAGYRDKEGTLHNTFTIRQMTGEDEEALARFRNAPPVKQMTMLAERLIESIGTLRKADMNKKDWHDLIEDLYIADLDCIMLHIRETSVGEALELRHICAECKTEITTRMTVDELSIIEWDGEEGIPFELRNGVADKDGNVHSTGIIRYPRVRDREATVPIAVKNAARGTTLMLTRLVQFDDEEFKCTEKVIQKMSTLDRRYLNRLMDENQFGLDMSVPIECPECGNSFDGIISVGNFI